jgi:hypothetical protein
MEGCEGEIGDVLLKGVGLFWRGVVFGKVPARGMEAQLEGTCMYLMVEDK